MTSTSVPPLVSGEIEILNRDEVLRRQIHPHQMKQNQITSGVFSTRSNKVSTYRDAVVTAAEAHRIHTEEHGRETIGSCVVSVGDVQDAELRAVDDSALPDEHPSHAYIDMRGLGSSAKDKAAKKLKRAALQNPIWHPPT